MIFLKEHHCETTEIFKSKIEQQSSKLQEESVQPQSQGGAWPVGSAVDQGCAPAVSAVMHQGLQPESADLGRAQTVHVPPRQKASDPPVRLESRLLRTDQDRGAGR